MSNLENMRISYQRGALDLGDVAADPFEQFDRWMRDASAADILEPNAMTLATATALGEPSARIVLLRGVEPAGFVFFTNYESQKGLEIASNPHAALLFFWPALERQVRIEGSVSTLPEARSDAYFEQRPRGHRVSAWASKQSSVVPDRAFLEARMSEEDTRLGADVPRPGYWGGYIVAPKRFEFWQGRRNRLHDRIAYRRADEPSAWLRERLSP